MNIELKTLCELTEVTGEAGNFEVELIQSPRYVDESKCVGCGACAEECPEKVYDAYNTDISKRKAIYVEYAQAVPLKYRIDAAHCLYLTKGKCGTCKNVCPAEAIDYNQKEEKVTLNVGSIVLAPGFEPFNPAALDNYQYANFANVVTSMEFERILSASGPTQGHVTTLAELNEKEPKKIAWLQCIGSRDINQCDNPFCSSVCCMYAVKEAVIAKEHAGDDLDCSIFFMDMRTHGKDYEKYYNDAKDKHGIRFIRSRIHTITEDPETKDLHLRYVTETGEMATETYDMVVLSIGLQASKSSIKLAKDLDINLTSCNFCETASFSPVATSRDGIFACGAFQGPKDIPQVVIDASAAAEAAGEMLAPSRGTETKKPEVIPEINIIGERPRIGVFVCSCGSNIAGTVDVKDVTNYSENLPYVEFATNNLYTCSQDAQDIMVQIIKDKKLNRVVVAACTPKTHEPLFKETLVNSGLNKYLFEMTNIRNHDSWVHKNQPELATLKAKDLVRMAVSKVALMAPLEEAELQVTQSALVIGGGVAGLAAADSLAAQGYETHLVERDAKLGGQALNLYETSKGENVQKNLKALIDNVVKNDKIHLHTDTQIENVDGFVGNFTSTLSSNGTQTSIEHGVAIIATGGLPAEPLEYSYGDDERIITSSELDIKLIQEDPSLKDINSAVFIQCVGSRNSERPYCSRVCCTHSIENALHLKKLNPNMNVYILYRDIRTYGERELKYKEARKAGVIFIRYDLDHKPKVSVNNKELAISITDHILGREIILNTDLLTLATAIVPNEADDLAKFFKISTNEEGFFAERHAKLGPCEFASDGVFLCGLAHYPKPIDESIAQAKAAASRAITLLARKNIYTSGTVAAVDPAACSACGVCISICPYSAPSFIEEDARFFPGKAQINPILCKGCGLCVATCRSGALHLKGFDNNQIFAQIYAVSDAA